MRKLFDIELFLAGVLTGAHDTRVRHIQQAKLIQAAISKRWQRDSPWTWQRKHLAWFLEEQKNSHATSCALPLPVDSKSADFTLR
ncbi:hypothetical protein D9M71_407660 [compost metagenome]